MTPVRPNSQGTVYQPLCDWSEHCGHACSCKLAADVDQFLQLLAETVWKYCQHPNSSSKTDKESWIVLQWDYFSGFFLCEFSSINGLCGKRPSQKICPLILCWSIVNTFVFKAPAGFSLKGFKNRHNSNTDK